MKKSLKNAGIEDIYKKSWKYISIDMEQLQCDFLEMEQGNALALNTYRGNYLESYSWAEYTNGALGHYLEH